MNNNDGVPEGWAVPDDLAKKINEVLNNKPITPEDELSDALVEMARDIALIEPNPEDWGGWINYLLEKFREEAVNRGESDEFASMLDELKQSIDNLRKYSVY